MGIARKPSTCEREARRTRELSLLLGSLTLLGVVVALSHPGAGYATVRGPSLLASGGENSSSESDPAGSGSAIVCPSSGPIIVGVQWNCVAVLNLTELVLLLVGIGIIAYVFKDDDQAELPGESAEVPVTAEEWEAYRADRERGIPYRPAESESGEEGL